MLKRADDLIDRAGKLDDAVANLRAFRSLVEELDRRGPIPFSPHLGPIRIVRAASLRSTIALIIAILDGKRDDRASIGQMLKLLGDAMLENYFMEKRGQGSHAAVMRRKLSEMRDQYSKVIDSDSFKRVVKLRHDEIGHLLLRNEDTPTSEHAEVFWLADEAERLVRLLYEGLAMPKPHFVEMRRKTDASVKLFWDTYLAASGLSEEGGRLQ
ncbi:MAG TPA: hypothetical protein VNV18_00945 [Stellaceae bacterium]|jgi:hypothetical protein|nr:hypothetical protein [Stellaceae bacterium]